MTHLFMGLDPHWIIREPYIPVVNRPGIVKAAALGLQVNPAARVFVFPNIGSYFGGDLIAGILYAGLHRASDTAILVDVGTNAEVVVGNDNWLIACAGVAGTFGSFIDPRSAITIGILPDLPLESYKPLGNSSLGGAALALTSEKSLAEIDRIRDRITYMELNVNQDFMTRFSAANFLPHTTMRLYFPRSKPGKKCRRS